jgi:DNA-directed RNA polymerase sigma subunit (sigma70/sigma32)
LKRKQEFTMKQRIATSTSLNFIKKGITKNYQKLTKAEVNLLSADIQASLVELVRLGYKNTFTGRSLCEINANSILKRGFEARQHLILVNQALAMSLTLRYYKGCQPDAAVQQAFVSLVRAAELYNHTTGYAFSTYLGFWLRQSTGLSVTFEASSINAPGQLKALRSRLKGISDEFRAIHCKSPTEDDLVLLTNLDVELVRKALLVPIEVSIDEPQSSDEFVTRLETLESPDTNELIDIDFDLIDVHVFDELLFGKELNELRGGFLPNINF